MSYPLIIIGAVLMVMVFVIWVVTSFINPKPAAFWEKDKNMGEVLALYICFIVIGGIGLSLLVYGIHKHKIEKIKKENSSKPAGKPNTAKKH